MFPLQTAVHARINRNNALVFMTFNMCSVLNCIQIANPKKNGLKYRSMLNQYNVFDWSTACSRLLVHCQHFKSIILHIEHYIRCRVFLFFLLFIYTVASVHFFRYHKQYKLIVDMSIQCLKVDQQFKHLSKLGALSRKFNFNIFGLLQEMLVFFIHIFN